MCLTITKLFQFSKNVISLVNIQGTQLTVHCDMKTNIKICSSNSDLRSFIKMIDHLVQLCNLCMLPTHPQNYNDENWRHLVHKDI